MQEGDELQPSEAVAALFATGCLSPRFAADNTGDQRGLMVADVSASLRIPGPVFLRVGRSGGQLRATVACLDFVWTDEPMIPGRTDGTSTLLVKCEPNYPDLYVIAMGGKQLRKCLYPGSNLFLQALGHCVVADARYKDNGFFFDGMTTREGRSLAFRFKQALAAIPGGAGATGRSEPATGERRSECD